MTVGELRRRVRRGLRRQTRSFTTREFRCARIAWRIQANAEEGLPDRGGKRALEIADDADSAPVPPVRPVINTEAHEGRVGGMAGYEVAAADRIPMPGALGGAGGRGGGGGGGFLFFFFGGGGGGDADARYRGRTSACACCRRARLRGTVDRSLSAVAQAVTGAHGTATLLRHQDPQDDGDGNAMTAQPKPIHLVPKPQRALRRYHPQEQRGGDGAGVQLARRPWRESGAAYIASQKNEGVDVPCVDRYDDAGSAAATWTTRLQR